ncbi:hypothetical protein [Streptomyces sp. NPDC046939]
MSAASASRTTVALITRNRREDPVRVLGGGRSRPVRKPCEGGPA